MLKRKKKKGFTLIELIIVIAIIAILAAIAIPKFGDIRRNAALKSDVANAKVIANAASALIAEGKIAVPGSDLIININEKTATGGGSGYKASEAASDLVDYLQNTPEPESSGYNSFIVKVDNLGNVTLGMNKLKTALEIGFDLYPNADSDTELNGNVDVDTDTDTDTDSAENVDK